MANDVNMSQRTISCVENGEENLKFSTVDSIVEHFSIPAYFLFLPDKITFREFFENPILCEGVTKLMYMFYLTEKRKNSNSPDVISYGIETKNDENEVFRIDDISEDKGFVEYLADMCNSYKIPLEHFLDIVRDAMVEKQMNETDDRFNGQRIDFLYRN